MIQAAATFSAGVLAAQQLGASCGALPSCRLRNAVGDQGTNFKLAVHVHGAAVPELNDPWMLLRQQPQLQAFLGEARKETEVADFVGVAERRISSNSETGGRAPSLSATGVLAECAWRFGDTLTFAAGLGDILGTGLQLQLCTCRDVCLGPLQVQLPQKQDLGEAVLDLRCGVLPMCELAVADGKGGFGGSGRPEWATPTLVVPLTRIVHGAQVEVVARVVLSFSVNADPEALLHEAERVEQTCLEKLAHCLKEPTGSCSRLCSRHLECGSRPLCGPQGLCGPPSSSEMEAPLVVQVCAMSSGRPDARLLTTGQT